MGWEWEWDGNGTGMGWEWDGNASGIDREWDGNEVGTLLSNAHSPLSKAYCEPPFSNAYKGPLLTAMPRVDSACSIVGMSVRTSRVHRKCSITWFQFQIDSCMELCAIRVSQQLLDSIPRYCNVTQLHCFQAVRCQIPDRPSWVRHADQRRCLGKR